MRLLLLLWSALILCAPGHAQDSALRIPPLHTSFEAGGRTIPVTAWATVSSPAPQVFRLALTADLAGLQDNITPVLTAGLNRSDRCGERLSVKHAVLDPAEPAALLTVSLRYERWACAKVFGKEAARRLVGGNAVVVVTLTPSLGPDGIRMAAEVKKIDADGSLGEVLRSGSLGATVKQKIAGSIENAIRKSLDLKAGLPERIGAAAEFESIRFSSGPQDHLWIAADAALHLSPSQLEAISHQVRH